MKKIVYGVEIQTTDAQGSIKRIEERLQALNQTADSSQKEINGLTQELKELGQTRTDQTENVNSVQNLKRAYRELIQQINETEQGTDRFRELTAEAGKLKNQIDDATNSVRNLSGSPFQNLNRGFLSLRQNILALNLDGVRRNFGDISTAIGQLGVNFIGVQRGAGIAANGLKVFRAAVIGTGVGALVIGITTLIANFETLKESGGVIGSLFTFLGNLFDSTTKAVLKLSDAIGLTNKAYDTYVEKQIAANTQTTKAGEKVETLEEKVARLNKELDDEALTQFQKNMQQTSSNAQDLSQFVGELTDKIIDKTKELNKLQSQLSTLEDIEQRGGVAAQQQSFINRIAFVRREIIKFEKEIEDINKERDKAQETRLKNELKAQRLAGDESFEQAKFNLERKEREAKTSLNVMMEVELADTKLTEEQRKEIEENFKNDRLILEEDFLFRKLNLYKRFNRDVSELELQASVASLNTTKEFVDKEIEERRRIIDEAFKITPDTVEAPKIEDLRKEDIKNANERIRLYEKEINFVKQLTQDKEVQLMQDINLADEKIRILEQYNLQETEQYKDAVRARELAELNFFRYKEELRKKDEEDFIRSEDERRSAIERTAQLTLQTMANASGQIQGILNKQYAYEMELAGDNQEAIEKIQKEQFETNKAFGIVDTIISTAMAIMNVWATAPNPIAGGILSAVVGALGAAQVGVIASQQFVPGSAASSSSSFTPNTGQSLAGVGGFSPNINFAAAGSGMNVQTAGGGTQQSIDFTGSISVSEINDVQNLVNIYETSSIIGGGG